MCRYLQSSGKEYNVRFAYDGDEGWLSLCQQPPDLVMLDVIMPGRNGFEIIEELKRKGGLSYTLVLACLKALVNVSRDEMVEKR